jgi:hypothetical protein
LSGGDSPPADARRGESLHACTPHGKSSGAPEMPNGSLGEERGLAPSRAAGEFARAQGRGLIAQSLRSRTGRGRAGRLCWRLTGAAPLENQRSPSRYMGPRSVGIGADDFLLEFLPTLGEAWPKKGKQNEDRIAELGISAFNFCGRGRSTRHRTGCCHGAQGT